MTGNLAWASGNKETWIIKRIKKGQSFFRSETSDDGKLT